MTGAMTAPLRAGADLRLLRAAVFAAVCVTLSAAGHEMASGAAIPPWALLAGWAGVFAVAAALAGRERSLPGIAALMLGGQIALHLLFSTGQWCAMAAPASNSRGGGQVDRVMALAGRLVCGSGRPPLTFSAALRLVRQAGIDPAAAAPAVPGVAGMPGMPGMAGYSGTQGVRGAATGMAGMHGAMGYSLPMIAGHLVAALVAGWLLRRGEAALWRVVRLSARGASLIAVRFPLLTAIAAVRALGLAGTLPADRPTVRRPRRDERGAGRPESVTLQHSVVRRGPPRVALAA